MLWRHGIWLQPASLAGDPEWQHRGHKFCDNGGAQMLVFDVDGDGDADVVNADHAHGYGLSWFQQVGERGQLAWRRHRIMGHTAADNAFGVAVGNLHALCAADVDGDGLTDVITGNRFFAHGGRDAADCDKARLLWFRCVRDANGASFVPYEVDDHSGVGTQVVAGDVDGDDHVDVVVSNKMGTFVHRQRRRAPTANAAKAGAAADDLANGVIAAATTPPVQQQQQDPQPPRARAGSPPKAADGRILNFDFETGDLRDWTARGDAFRGVVDGDAVAKRRNDMQSGHSGRYWIGSYEYHASDAPRGTLTSVPFELTQPFVSFLIAGGDQRHTRVEIVAEKTGEVLHRSVGQDHEQLARVEVDLGSHVGERIFVRLVDDSSDGWGHLNFDDFRLHSAAERSGGFPVAETMARMTLPEGFRVSAFAAEPDVRQPIAMAVDEAGRLWIAEAFAYPQRQPEGEGKDRIVVFTDRDGDGVHDERTVFLDNLNLVSGLQVGYGGVFVGAAPTLSFVPDRDRDLVPDGPAEVLLDGWHYEDTHETLNAFAWGPDGWLYGCHGVFTHSEVGAPGTPADARQPLNAGVWRFHPVRREFEVFAHGTSNPWGVDFDARGQAFITACVIPHLYHVVQGGVYRRQSGSHFNPFVYGDLDTIADHVHYVGSSSHVGNRISAAAGGGHAHCGALIYRGGRWPQAYDGAILMENIHGRRINMDLLRRRGSGYVASHGPDFMVCDDDWFLAVALATAHDGNVYVIDWYDDQHCHLRESEAWDRSNGRIYKLAYGDAIEAPRDLGALPDAALVALVFDANETISRHARRLLTERRALAVAPALLTVFADAKADEARRLRAAWTLWGIGALDDAALLSLCSDRHEYVRAFAIQFAAEDRNVSPAQLAAFAQLAANDPSPAVRLYLAAALQRLPLADRWAIAEALAQRADDKRDHNLPRMVWFGIEPAVPTDPQRALALAQRAELPRLAEFLFRRLVEAGGEALDAAIAQLANAPDAATAARWMGYVQRGLDRTAATAVPASWAAARAHVEQFADDKCQDAATWLAAAFGDPAATPALQRIAADTKAPRERRERAFEQLLRQRGAAAELRTFVDDPLLGERAIRALATADGDDLPRWLLAKWQVLPPARQGAVVATLCSRQGWARELLDAVAAGQVPRSSLDAPTRQQLAQLGDDALQQRLQEVWGRSASGSAATADRIAAYRQQLTRQTLAKADLPNGRALFARTCAACHRLFGEGVEFGPDLTGSNRRDLDYLLGNILEPGREVARDYMLASVHLHSGAIAMGMLVDETDTSITVRTQFQSQVLARTDIARIERSEQSLMPPGQLDGMSDDDVRDLIAYLGAERQVPMRANAQNAWQLFSGQSLSLWDADPAIWSVDEEGELIGKTTGLARNDFARSQLLLGDFELEFEVKLFGDSGNSGVQFRSEVLADGDVRGYQADIGPGWWGKLYEEHGRGLLVADDRDALVQRGEWNHYRIVARGSRVQTFLNGKPCVDLDDPQGAREGIIALQVHSGGPTEVRFRNFMLKVQ